MRHSIFSLLIFLISGLPSTVNAQENNGLDFKGVAYPEEEKDTDRKEKHSISIYTGAPFSADDDYSHYFLGLEYEIKTHDFAGIGINIRVGNNTLNNNEMVEITDDYKPEFQGWQYFDADMLAVSVHPNFYLLLDDETGFSLFAGAGMGIRFIKSEGKIVTPDNVVVFSEKRKLASQFYYSIKAGAEIRVLRKFSVGVALGGDNLDFSSAYKNLDWDENRNISRPPGSALNYSLSFKFHF
ncbi:MAG: hypothetical protein ACQETJ_00340 [Bacteroidota bacterium]